jgi:broad specificity phosphatase PhoE
MSMRTKRLASGSRDTYHFVSSEPLEILLVRHGESEGNAQDRMQGRSDFPLTEHGRGQARALGAWLRAQRLKFAASYASPLKRAWETAEILRSTAGVPELAAEPSLAEIHAGALEGLTFTGIGEQFPSYLARGVGGIGDFAEFGGESYEAVQARALELKKKLEMRHRHPGERVLCVGHGGLNFQLLKLCICEPVPRVCIVRMGNCSATLVRFRERRGTFLGEIVWHVPVELMQAPSAPW